MTNQDKIFNSFEGDKWFDRNKGHLSLKDDMALLLIEMYKLKPKRVLEIGACNGYRLSEINKRYNSKVFAVEPSIEAIKDGKKKWPFINFERAAIAEMQQKEQFDLVIVNSVLHWVDRKNLLESVSKIDRVTKNNGLLILGDFQTPIAIKRKYKHIEDLEVFTYKLNYKNIFLATGFYKEVAALSRDHDTKFLTTKTKLENFFSVSLLKKEDLYIKQEDQ
ncbi:MAG: class I SAM-dependent methyltransferase [Candidatus Staskawiczbacteria bacterium]